MKKSYSGSVHNISETDLLEILKRKHHAKEFGDDVLQRNHAPKAGQFREFWDKYIRRRTVND
jgi:hypothetical protein